MLSRVADALYWMSRYVERAEHAARLLEVIRRTRIDLEEVDPSAAARQWNDALGVLGAHGATLENAVYEEREPGSVASSLFRARENARQVQEVISSEMWDYLNQSYWALDEAAASRHRAELVPNVLAEVVKQSFLWSGVTDSTMGRGAGWLLIRLGQFVERAELTSRIFSVQWRTIEEVRSGLLFQTGENLFWHTLLRSLSSFEEYRKRFPARIEPRQVAEFLLLDRAYPRTVRYSVSVAADLSRRLAEWAQRPESSTVRRFGRLSAKLEYIEIGELFERGSAAPAELVDELVAELHLASAELQREYFLH